MQTTYFKTIIQKSTETHSIMISVIPNDMLGLDLPNICEIQSQLLPQTIYTGTYPQIKLNPETIVDRSDLKGNGIAVILTQDMWYTKTTDQPDDLGIGIQNKSNSLYGASPKPYFVDLDKTDK